MTEKIKDNLYWIGIDNKESRDFHGIYSPRGGSYNSSLIMDELPTIIDTTNIKFYDIWINSLKSVISPEKIKYIIINHAEPDHTGALCQILDECKDAKIICSERCKEFLLAQYNINHDIITVKENEELSIGKNTLKFIMDPMVHWPETMMTYLIQEKILFSGDLFATEISHEHLFSDEFEPYDKLTRDYFTLVMRPFYGQVKKAIDKVKLLDLKLLCPSHGPFYRKNIDKIINLYEKLAIDPTENKVLIPYVTIWHSTEKMAEEIAKGVREEGFECKTFDITKTNCVELMAEALTSKGVIIGSLTFAGGYHPDVDPAISFFTLNNQKGKKFAVFSSYGWINMANPKLQVRLTNAGFDVIDSIEFRFGPKNQDDYNALNEFGKNFVKKLN
jgi:anaerobic nitric oxide reductase flavorubredoxin